MAMCKFCGAAFAWGQDGDRWVPLVPLGDEAELPREFQDHLGNFRASHRLVCTNRGGATVKVERLAKAVAAADILPSVKPKVEKPEDPISCPTTVGEHILDILNKKAQRRRERKERAQEN
jgi:hypothetical protein